jgi:hypothetical protein
MKTSDKQLSGDEGFAAARKQVYHESWKEILKPLVKVQEQGGFMFRGTKYFPVLALINNDHPEALLMTRVMGGGWPCRLC